MWQWIDGKFQITAQQKTHCGSLSNFKLAKRKQHLPINMFQGLFETLDQKIGSRTKINVSKKNPVCSMSSYKDAKVGVSQLC